MKARYNPKTIFRGVYSTKGNRFGYTHKFRTRWTQVISKCAKEPNRV